jgi:hypothetical protein
MNNSTNAIDEFVRTKVAPEYQPLVDAFRSLVKDKFPELQEGMRGGTEGYPGTPIYRLKRIVVVINPTPNFVTFAFSDGKSFTDKYRLLEGVGNKAANIRLKSVEEFSVQQMTYYLQQAIDIDQKK